MDAPIKWGGHAHEVWDTSCGSAWVQGDRGMCSRIRAQRGAGCFGPADLQEGQHRVVEAAVRALLGLHPRKRRLPLVEDVQRVVDAPRAAAGGDQLLRARHIEGGGQRRSYTTEPFLVLYWGCGCPPDKPMWGKQLMCVDWKGVFVLMEASLQVPTWYTHCEYEPARPGLPEVRYR